MFQKGMCTLTVFFYLLRLTECNASLEFQEIDPHNRRAKKRGTVFQGAQEYIIIMMQRKRYLKGGRRREDKDAIKGDNECRGFRETRKRFSIVHDMPRLLWL